MPDFFFGLEMISGIVQKLIENKIQFRTVRLERDMAGENIN